MLESEAEEANAKEQALQGVSPPRRQSVCGSANERDSVETRGKAGRCLERRPARVGIE
jgi:hypothetical protein